MPCSLDSIPTVASGIKKSHSEENSATLASVTTEHMEGQHAAKAPNNLKVQPVNAQVNLSLSLMHMQGVARGHHCTQISPDLNVQASE